MENLGGFQIILQLHGDEGGVAPPPAGGNTNPVGGDGAGGASPPGNGNGAGAASGAGTPATPQAPERYEFKLAEGLEISEALQTRLTTLAKGANMTQDTVDQLLQMHGEVIKDALNKADEQRNRWAEECAQKGLNTEQNMQKAKLAINTFGGESAMQALINTGAAYHPAIQAMLQTIGGLLSEDPGAGGQAAGGQPDIGSIMFPNSK